MTSYIYSSSFTAVFSILLGFFVLFKNSKNLVNQTWFLTTASIAGWSGFLCLAYTSNNISNALFYSKISQVSAAFIPVFMTHFTLALTQNPQRKFLILGYLNCIAIVILALTDHFITVKPISVFDYYPSALIGYHFFTVHFFIFLVYHEYLLLISIPNLPKVKANQVKYIFVAVTSGYLSGIVTFLPVYGIPINPVTSHFVWLYAAGISYAIAKHHLMDITIALKKGLLYTLLVGIITAIYFASVYLASLYFQSVLGYNEWPYVLSIVTIIALCFKPLERKLSQLVDLLIFKKTSEMIAEENKKLLEEMRRQDQLKTVAILAAGMAHEIKNPLTSIRTFAEYLPTKYDDPEFREKFQRIVVDEVDRVNNIIKQLLDFSKPEKTTTSDASLSLIIEETLTLLNNNLVKNRIRFSKKLDESIVVSVDRNLIKQALLNLFLNAIQAMPDGGLLTVESSNVGDFAKFTIRDSGVGIPAENIPHIFNPFYTTKEEGTGLGLSIVHGIIHEHGGKITVQSEMNKGTTVSVTLKNRN